MSEFDHQVASLSPAKRALFEQLSRQKPRAPEPIAIIGMGCRFPDKAVSPQAYWSMLREGATAVREVPASRWNPDAYYSSDPDAPGKSVSRWGAFLTAVEWFDADLFGIPPRQAIHMDPQHRVLLEVAFEALEDAAMPPLDLAGMRAGVYVGITFLDYAFLELARIDRIDALSAPGLGLHGAAGRISHAFGLEGPSLAVDTACSSSLVAVHLACQALRTMEVDMSLAAGVNLVLSPANTVAGSKLRLLSPDGRTRPFDAQANGYVRGEGCGVLVLKRMSDAVTDGDRVLAVIRGSAVNQDGRATGYAIPNGHAQRGVLKAALENAGMAAADIGYVEAQGTATPLGDSVEADALADVFGRSRTHDHPLIVGAAKGNVGHLEAAAGMASMIKAVLALRHGEVPRNLNLQELHPDIVQRRAPLLFPRDHTLWPRGVRPRAAGVSAFGVSGTNAHIVLSEAPDPPAPSRSTPHGRHALVVVSGFSDQAVWDGALRLHEMLEKNRDADLHDLALTSTAGRSHLASRLAVCVSTTEGLEQRLSEFLWGRASGGLFSGRAPATPARVGFIFSGEAAAPSGAGQVLYRHYPAFQSHLDHLSELARPWLPAPIPEFLWAGPAQEARPAWALAPARLALELALVQLWKSVGMIPDFVGGYGSGEYTAACVAGALSPADAMALARDEARLWEEHARDLVTIRVQAPAPRLAALLDAGEAFITADEGPSCVLAGQRNAIERLSEALKRERFAFSPCRGPHKSGPSGDLVAGALARTAEAYKVRVPALRLFSGTERSEVPPGEAPGPGHWAEHARRPVRLAAMVQAMEDRGCDILVEVGADSPFSRRLATRSRTTWLPTLAIGRDDDEVFLSAMTGLFVRGAVVDVRALGRPSPARKTDLPSYPFQRKRYWLDAETTAGNGRAAQARARRDLITELAQTQEKDRRPLLHRYVASEIAHVLGLESAAGLREDSLLSEVGLDSILAVDLLRVLRRDLSLDLAASLFYDHPTLMALVKYLERALSLSVTPAEGIVRLTPQSPGGSPGSRE
ncbi:MAG TPA: type I polyketide synthase [Myxococcaceae bacterium]|jgi:acyl transferase domain-containing protein